MAEGAEERNKENGSRPNGNYNHRRRHHGHRPGNNQNRYHNGPKPEGETTQPDAAYRPNNNRGQNYQRRDSYRHHEPVKAVESLEDIQKDIRRIEKEIEMEISEISAAKLGV